MSIIRNKTQSAFNATRELATVPLSLLVPSIKNVRRSVSANSATLAELAESIAALGVLQNLAVSEHVKSGKPTGKYQVDAGGRRLKALQLLLKAKRISAEFEVPVSIGPAETATVTSLAENTHREAMHPADEFDAFQVLIDQGKSVADIAQLLGYPEVAVKRRLKLAAVSPRLMALYREGGIALDQLMALAIVDDHAEQERVWDEAPEWQRSAENLRLALTHDEVDSASSAIAKYVGLDAYTAAGGPVRRDLFRDSTDCYLLDSALLLRLAREKLEAEAKPVYAEGWSWIEIHADRDDTRLYDFSRARRERRTPNKKETTALAAVDKRLAELQEAYDKLDEDGDDSQVVDELDELELKRDGLLSNLEEWGIEAKQVAGVIVTIGKEAKMEINRGLVRAEDRKRLTQRAPVNGEDHDLGATKAPKGEFSERLLRNLTAHRTAAMQAMLAQNPEVALVATVHRFALETFYAHGHTQLSVDGLSALQVTVTHADFKVKNAAPEVEHTRAGTTLATLRFEWEGRLPSDAEALFDWIRQESRDVQMSLLAFCAAASVDVIAHMARSASESRPLANALGLQMADWWTATPETYFNHVPKAKALSAVTEAVSATAATELVKLKKDALAESAARKIAGTRWLPSVLR